MRDTKGLSLLLQDIIRSQPSNVKHQVQMVFVALGPEGPTPLLQDVNNCNLLFTPYIINFSIHTNDDP